MRAVCAVPCGWNPGFPGTADAAVGVQLLDKQRLHHVVPLHHMVSWAVAPEAIAEATCIVGTKITRMPNTDETKSNICYADFKIEVVIPKRSVLVV